MQDFKAKMQKIRFLLGAPDASAGSLQHSPDPVAGAEGSPDPVASAEG